MELKQSKSAPLGFIVFARWITNVSLSSAIEASSGLKRGPNSKAKHKKGKIDPSRKASSISDRWQQQLQKSWNRLSHSKFLLHTIQLEAFQHGYVPFNAYSEPWRFLVPSKAPTTVYLLFNRSAKSETSLTANMTEFEAQLRKAFRMPYEKAAQSVCNVQPTDSLLRKTIEDLENSSLSELRWKVDKISPFSDQVVSTKSK